MRCWFGWHLWFIFDPVLTSKYLGSRICKRCYQTEVLTVFGWKKHP